MNDEELRDALRRADPMPPERPVVDPTSPLVHQLLEAIMSTDTHDAVPTAAAPEPARPARPWARPALAAAAVALLAGAGIGVWQVTADDAPDAPPLALSVAPFDPVSSMCMAFDPAQLEGVELAFSGTVASIEDGTVTVEVADVFRGEVPDTVTLDAGASPALDGVAFEQGGTYLVAADDGTVGGCGSSGPDEPTLRAAYEQVFGKP